MEIVKFTLETLFHGTLSNLKGFLRIFVGQNRKLVIVLTAMSSSQGLTVLCKAMSMMNAGNTKDCLGMSGWNWGITHPVFMKNYLVSSQSL